MKRFRECAITLAQKNISKKNLARDWIKDLYVPRCGGLQSRRSSTRGCLMDLEEVVTHACAGLDANIQPFVLGREEVTESSQDD